MNIQSLLTNHDKIGLYIAIPLVAILIVALLLWLLQKVNPVEDDMKKWEDDMDDYFKRKDYEND